MYTVSKINTERLGVFKISGKPILSTKETILYKGKNEDFAMELMIAFASHYNLNSFNLKTNCFIVKERNITTTYRLERESS